MAKLETTCLMESFRRFMITSTCRSFIPNEYGADFSVFPERARELGTMYVEAEDKVTLGRVNDISFVRVSYVLGIIISLIDNKKTFSSHSFLTNLLILFSFISFFFCQINY